MSNSIIIKSILTPDNLYWHEGDIDIIDSIDNSYSEHFRYYHNFDHILDCLDEFKEVEDQFNHPNLAKFAILYHDIVCIPGYGGNEEASIVRACYDASILGISKEDQNLIVSCIRVTNHKFIPTTKGCILVKDIDLSILGQDKDKFMRYEDSIREEYNNYDTLTYSSCRLSFLNKLLNEPRIYLSDYFYEKYEKKARDNIKHSIEILNSTR